MAVYFPHLIALLHSGMKDAARCVDDLCCDVTEEECHVTRDTDTRRVTEGVPVLINNNIARLHLRENRN